MKKLYSKTAKVMKSIISLSLLVLCFSACGDQLDIAPTSSISSISAFENENDAEGALYGMYDQFRNTLSGRPFLFRYEFRTGFWDYGTSGGAADWDNLWDNTLFPTSSGTNWDEYYRLINDSNLILKNTPNIDFSNEQRKNEILGHAFFLRAFAYFHLAKLWGDVPIAVEGFESVDQELNLSRSPVEEVFSLIKDDINQAINLLPEESLFLGDTPVIANKSAAYMLKTDIYLWTAKRENGGAEDLNEANLAIDNVLSSSKYQLLEEYEQVFREESNSETIFSIYYSVNEGNQFGNQLINSVATVPAGARDSIPAQSGPQWMILNDYFNSEILKPASEDERTDVIWKEVVVNDLTIKWINKYQGEIIAGTREFTDNVNVYRFSEAILFKAEIENALGNQVASISQLNRVASRAYGIDDYYSAEMNQEQVDNAILDERLIEFAVEGKSWFDIIRFGEAFDRIESLRGREGDNNGNILYFPVAQDVINRNEEISQTPGY